MFDELQSLLVSSMANQLQIINTYDKPNTIAQSNLGPGRVAIPDGRPTSIRHAEPFAYI